MRGLLILLLVVAVAYGVYSYISSPKLALTDEVRVSNDTLTISDQDSPAYFSYHLNQSLDMVSGAIFQYRLGSASVEEVGRILIISYLDGTAYQTFKTVYSGDISKCPAPFLNANAKTLHLFIESEVELAKLQAGIDQVVPGQKSIDFTFSGRYLSFAEAKAKNGRALAPDFGGQPLFFIESVERMR